MTPKKTALTRRQALSATAALAATSAVACAPGASEAGTKPAKKPLVLDYKNPKWNRDAMARIHGNTDFSKEKIGWYKGKAIGVVPGQKNIEICGFEGFSVTRLIPLEGGAYRKLLREVGFYTDLKTGEILEELENPYTGEVVRVVPIANDPFNFTIEEFWPEPPNYGGLNTEKPPRVPMLKKWQEKGDTVLMESDIHLFYPSALQPAKWPRESPGKFTQVSELFRYIIDRNQLGDPDNTSVEFFGTWARITPWFPWLLMDQAPGHCSYMCDMGAWDHWDFVPQHIIDAAKAIDPKYLSAPTEDYGPSLSSLEWYAREQTPAKPRK
jgi:hypothetical protein